MTLDAADISAIAQLVARTLQPSGRAWFVAKTGNNANDGLSWNTAKLTIAAATASAGDVIIIGPGTFSEAVDFTGIGIIIRGAGYLTIISAATSPALIVGDGSKLRDFDAVATSAGSEGTVAVQTLGICSIENCRFTATNTGAGTETALQVTDTGTTARACIFTGDVSGAPRLYDSEVVGAATSSICFGCKPESLNGGNGGDVLDEPLAGHQTAGTVGSAISALLEGSGGAGDIAVDHNTGGLDALQFKFGGVPSDNVTIKAYLKSEYDAGTFTVRGTAFTGPDGRWLNPMMLNAGTYVIVGYVPGVSGPKATTVTVS